MRSRVIKAGLVGVVASMLAASSLIAHGGDDNGGFLVSADLIGYQEVPALSTVARGHFKAWVDTRANTITYKLTYDALEGNVTQSHVHFGQMGVNGGISFFLCSNLGNGPVGTPACPAGPAVVEGVITADQVLQTGNPPPGQGIEAGAITEIIAAIRAGVSYANVHSSKWPGGEIRGQLH